MGWDHSECREETGQGWHRHYHTSRVSARLRPPFPLPVLTRGVSQPPPPHPTLSAAAAAEVCAPWPHYWWCLTFQDHPFLRNRERRNTYPHRIHKILVRLIVQQVEWSWSIIKLYQQQLTSRQWKWWWNKVQKENCAVPERPFSHNGARRRQTGGTASKNENERKEE